MSLSVDLVVIPVAGMGTRLLPATKSQPKEMLPVGAKPVVQYVVEEAAASGIRRVLFITGPSKTSIENHFDLNQELIAHLRENGKETLLNELDFERRGMEYFFTRQRKQLGLGHAVLCSHGFVGDQNFVVALGDTIIGADHGSRIISRLVAEFERTKADAVIAFQEVAPEEVTFYGIARPGAEDGESFRVEEIVEKPSRAEAPSRVCVSRRDLSAAGGDATEQGRRDSAHRRDPAPDQAGGRGAGRPARSAGAALRHRQLPQLFPRVLRSRPRRSAIRCGSARISASGPGVGRVRRARVLG
jgi:UTP--glucose-1-phosphate uridylyltransferase